jgi:hypothetical protein
MSTNGLAYLKVHLKLLSIFNGMNNVNHGCCHVHCHARDLLCMNDEEHSTRK